MKKIILAFMALWMSTQFSMAKSPNYFGVVIGCCSDYPNAGINGLHAKDDAEMFYSKLVQMYYRGSYNQAQHNISLLTESRATRANIKAHLKKFAIKAQRGDIFYFFYSGHGSSLEDKSRIIAPSYENNELIKVMEKSGLIVPYDFNFNKVGKTAIIGKRDLRKNGGYGFEYLDKKGVKVIMISDSCYSGNIFRGSPNSTRKDIPTGKLNINYDAEIRQINQNKNRPKQRFSEYQNLIFFSAGGTDKAVAEDDRLKRGKFSLVIEKCLLTANQNGDRSITKKEFQECLKTEDVTQAFVVYPPLNRRANSVVFKAVPKQVSIQDKDKIRVKTSLIGLERISQEIVLDNQNYDIEIMKIGNGYQIFRYTGEEYAYVNINDLQKYLHALKLFKLKGIGKLDTNVTNPYMRKSMGQYCKGEELLVNILNRDITHIVAITLDREGRVIMLQPNDYNNFSSSTIVKTKVQYPFGMDKVKVFALNNQQHYNAVKKLVVRGGELNEYAINKLYKILKNYKNYKEAEVDIETINKSVNYCRQGN